MPADVTTQKKQTKEVNVQNSHRCVDGKTSEQRQADWKDRVSCMFLRRRVRLETLLRLEKR